MTVTYLTYLHPKVPTPTEHVQHTHLQRNVGTDVNPNHIEVSHGALAAASQITYVSL
jgi:hypothetical protein